MALLRLLFVTAIIFAVSLTSVRGSQYPFRTIAIQIPMLLLAVIVPVFLIYFYFYLAGVGSSDAELFGQTHRPELMIIPVLIEELAKLTGLFILSNSGRVVLSFFTRLWSGLTFGLFELLVKLFTFPQSGVPQHFRVDMLTLAFLAVGIHSLTCYYPNIVRRWQTIVTLVVLVVFHFMYNFTIVSSQIVQQSGDDSIRQQLDIGWVPWLMLGFAYFVTLRNSRFTPSLWR